jgi:hypothetical protein
MRKILPVMLMALALPAAAQSHPTSDTDQAVPAYVTNAISDPARKADKADDSRRQMAAVMTPRSSRTAAAVARSAVEAEQRAIVRALGRVEPRCGGADRFVEVCVHDLTDGDGPSEQELDVDTLLFQTDQVIDRPRTAWGELCLQGIYNLSRCEVLVYKICGPYGQNGREVDC